MELGFVFGVVVPILILVWWFFKQNYEPTISDHSMKEAERIMHRYGHYKMEDILKFARYAKGTYADKMVWAHQNMNQSVPAQDAFCDSVLSSFSAMKMFERESEDKAFTELKKLLSFWSTDRIRIYYDLNAEYNMSGVVQCGVYWFDYNALAYYHALLIANNNPDLKLSPYLFDTLWHNELVSTKVQMEQIRDMSSFLDSFLHCCTVRDILSSCFFPYHGEPSQPFVHREVTWTE